VSGWVLFGWDAFATEKHREIEAAKADMLVLGAWRCFGIVPDAWFVCHSEF